MSLIDRIKASHSEAEENQIQTITVPRYEGTDATVTVTYKLASEEDIRKIGKVGENKKRDDATFQMYLQFHVDNATAITWTFKDGESMSFDSFGDETLSEALEVQNKSARNNVRALFIADGDVSSFADAICEWAGYKRQELEETVSGE